LTNIGASNGLLRQYFPKGTDLSVHSEADLDWVAAELNDKPRKRLAFKKPIEQIGVSPVALTAWIRRSANETGQRWRWW